MEKASDNELNNPSSLSAPVDNKQSTDDEPWVDSVDLVRKSLIYNENETHRFPFIYQTEQATTSGQQGIKKTHIFQHGHSSGSVFLDITGSSTDQIRILQEISNQYPTRIGVLIQQTGDTELAEINFDPNDKAIDTILERGLALGDNSVIIPCRAIDNNVDIVYLSLYSLPFMTEKQLAEVLEETLSHYGEVLDVGALLESTTKTYMCTGYAILNIFPKPDTRRKDLSHKIPCHKSNLKSFYAVWNNMPDHCQYCHVQDHTTSACPDAGTGEILWSAKRQDCHVEEEEGFIEYIHFLLGKKVKEDINLNVKGSDGGSSRFKIKRRTELRKLMNAYCKQHYLPPHNVKFFYKNHELTYDKTPDDLNMTDNDVINVMIEIRY